MMHSGQDDETNCPCLTPAAGRRAGVFSVLAYCRLANGRVRVPARDELASLCTAGQFHNCPGYCRWAASREWSGAPS